MNDERSKCMYCKTETIENAVVCPRCEPYHRASAQRSLARRRRTPSIQLPYCPKCGGDINEQGGCAGCMRNLRNKIAAKKHSLKDDPMRHLFGLPGGDNAFAERWFTHRPDQLAAINTNRGIHTRCLKYGLTVGQWMVMVAKQNSRCSICAIEMPALRLFIDHDHVTGQVRGLLCTGCNTGLGMLGIDGPEAHERATSVVRYLRNAIVKNRV